MEGRKGLLWDAEAKEKGYLIVENVMAGSAAAAENKARRMASRRDCLTNRDLVLSINGKTDVEQALAELAGSENVTFRVVPHVPRSMFVFLDREDPDASAWGFDFSVDFLTSPAQLAVVSTVRPETLVAQTEVRPGDLLVRVNGELAVGQDEIGRLLGGNKLLCEIVSTDPGAEEEEEEEVHAALTTY